MGKNKSKVSKRMLTAIFLAQVLSFLCLCVLKYNMDQFSTNYRTVESKGYDALLYLQSISSKVYEHENLTSRYLANTNESEYEELERELCELKNDTETLLIECDAALSGIETNVDKRQFEQARDAVTAYFNCADIAIDIKKNHSTELAWYLLNNKMIYYIDSANDAIDTVTVMADDNTDDVAAIMTDTINNARYFFMVGVVTCFVTTVICMVYCKRMLDEQERFMNEANAANMAKTVFLSNMSHEIRTPINAIIGLNEMITRESGDENILNYAKKIAGSSETLLGLINDVLDYSKIEAGKMELVNNTYRLDNMLIELWDLVVVRAKGKDLKILFDVNPNTPIILNGDAIRIKQIIINLLTNAVKYTPEGAVTLVVNYEKCSEDSIYIRFSVKDTGMGINPTEMDKLTAAFERIDEKKNSTIEGTGLGLSIVDRLLMLMDSQLEVSSIYGEGSTFSFTIMQKVEEWETIGSFRPQDRVVVTDKPKGPLFMASKAHILAVDDNEINRMVIEDLLRRTRVQVDLAPGGDEAFEMAKNKKYDVILMDHRMPGTDGIAAFHLIKGEGMNMDTPIIMVTANVGSDVEGVYVKEGFATSIKKPVNGDQLEETLLEYIPEELLDSEEEMAAAIDAGAGAAASGSEELYKRIVKEFVETSHITISEIENFYREGDIENYTIKVHALKSTAKMLGANQLSEEAKHLEACGDKKDIDEINEKTPVLLEHVKAVVEKLRVEHDIKEAERTAGQISDTMLLELLTAILEAAEEFDFDVIDSAMETLENYEVPENLNEQRRNLKDAAFSMDVDKISEIATRMKGELKHE